MRRFLALVTVAAIVLAAVPVAADHGYCWYDPDTMTGFGCTSADFAMIEAKTDMQVAANLGDIDMFWDAAARAAQIEREFGGHRLTAPGNEQDVLHVGRWVPLRHYQVLDSVEAGPNVRYATVPGRNGRPQLVFWDHQGRPMKIAGMNYTSRPERWIDIALAFAWGLVGGGGWISGTAVTAVSAGTVALSPAGAALADGAISLGLALAVSIPDAESTQVLVDVLHTLPDGKTQHVYRNRVVVARDGRLTVIEKAGQVWWKLDGTVQYDSSGNPVW